MTDCAASTTSLTDYDKLCKYYQDTFACYPSCYRKDDVYKSSRDAWEKSVTDSMKVIDSSKTCTVKCGSAAGLRAGAVTTLLVAAFALLAGH